MGMSLVGVWITNTPSNVYWHVFEFIIYLRIDTERYQKHYLGLFSD